MARMDGKQQQNTVPNAPSVATACNGGGDDRFASDRSSDQKKAVRAATNVSGRKGIVALADETAEFLTWSLLWLTAVLF